MHEISEAEVSKPHLVYSPADSPHSKSGTDFDNHQENYQWTSTLQGIQILVRSDKE